MFTIARVGRERERQRERETEREREHSTAQLSKEDGKGSRTSPVDGDVGRAVIELQCGAERAAGVDLTVAIQAVEQRAVVTHVESGVM
jgi:hypothetical protein